MHQPSSTDWSIRRPPAAPAGGDPDKAPPAPTPSPTPAPRPRPRAGPGASGPRLPALARRGGALGGLLLLGAASFAVGTQLLPIAGPVAHTAAAPFATPPGPVPGHRAPQARADALVPGAPAPGAADARPADELPASVQRYRLPGQLPLQGADGRSQPLRQALFDGRPLVLTCMFSGCTTVCPVNNQTLVAFEQLLGPERTAVHTASISIDPDHDTVQRLADYARRTGGRGAYYTGDPATSEAVQRALDAWRGDKMAHAPVFLLTTGPDRPWLRLDGLVSPRQLLQAYRELPQRLAGS